MLPKSNGFDDAIAEAHGDKPHDFGIGPSSPDGLGVQAGVNTNTNTNTTYTGKMGA